MAPEPPRPRRPLRIIAPVLLVVGGLAGAVYAVVHFFFPPLPPPPPAGRTDSTVHASFLPPMSLATSKHLTVWWDTVAVGGLRPSAPDQRSNIHPADYAGPDACKDCHQKNYQAWSDHPHRWMNVLATDQTVRGDFSGAASIHYRGGTGRFERRDGQYVMRLERDGVKRTYRITQTIGSRFYQYYVGKLVEGPEPPDHHFYHKDHVLPFGYWLGNREWVPTVHIGPEMPDEDRPDPFNPPREGQYYAEYAVGCNHCHTTFPLGDLMARSSQRMGEHAPAKMHWSVRGYLQAARPADLPAVARELTRKSGHNPMTNWDAEHYAATFGVSCEACHLGGREHVESGGRIAPRFFPASPNLSIEGKPPDPGRTAENTNWACGRCHTGGRPAFAGGMSTWNSVEYADAARGSCYPQLRCTDCHSPHTALGPKWTRTPDQDDAVCLKCHDGFRAADRRAAHTHHPPGSEGDRCLNCHMPRVNEGLQDVVRTHMIYSPTRADMIEANHPNACNLCHTDRPIDWTLERLKGWYGKTYDHSKIAANYPDRTRPVALGWLAGNHESVRLVAADALARTRDPCVIPHLIDALDDAYLLNRQFAVRNLEQMLGVRPSEVGYRFYMFRRERQQPLADLRAKFAMPPKAR